MKLNHIKTVQQVFIVLQTLGSSTPYDRCNGPPLSGHKLGQMKQLLLFFSGPFCFLDAGIQPLIPADKKPRYKTIIRTDNLVEIDSLVKQGLHPSPYIKNKTKNNHTLLKSSKVVSLNTSARTYLHISSVWQLLVTRSSSISPFTSLKTEVRQGLRKYLLLILIQLHLSVKTHHLALHCFADLRCNKEAIRDHWFFPYFITAALRISSWVNSQVSKETHINAYLLASNLIVQSNLTFTNN